MGASFGTKGQTLQRVSGLLHKARVLPFCIITHYEFLSRTKRGQRELVEEIKQKLLAQVAYDYPTNGLWAVRSSSVQEDNAEQSNAGKYFTALNVTLEDIPEAVIAVFDSYEQVNENSEVIVQLMAPNVSLSGVCFSHDLSSGAPYRIIGWSIGSDTTDVTSGKRANTWQIAAGSEVSPPSNLKAIVDLNDELLSIFDNTPIDFEFAITAGEKHPPIVWLLQVRPLVIKDQRILTTSEHNNLLAKAKSQLSNLFEARMISDKGNSVFGIMPDWNPAEIIGRRPRALALSLYKFLITDYVWSQEREKLGYTRNINTPLMVDIAGQPYIDVGASLRSLTPEAVPVDLREKAVRGFLKKLTEFPHLHDKMEFEVAVSCMTCDKSRIHKNLRGAGLASDEIAVYVGAITNISHQLIHPRSAQLLATQATIASINRRLKDITAAPGEVPAKIRSLLTLTQQYGARAFAVSARLGFIAVEVMQSLRRVGALTSDDYDSFFRRGPSLTKEFMLDQRARSKKTLIEKYGHLRPNSYEITSPRYDENPEWLLFKDHKSPAKRYSVAHHLSSETNENINDALRQSGFTALNSTDFLKFARESISLREIGKFEFTRCLSELIKELSVVGVKRGLSKEQLSHLELNDLIKMVSDRQCDAASLAAKAARNAEVYAQQEYTTLPPLITDTNQVWSFNWPEQQPNFITQGSVIDRVMNLEKTPSLLSGIVCIMNADPGFDWIFAHPITGLVTAFGGANSHMAIRANELGLPAVIGVGELDFFNYRRAKMLEIDCATKRLRVIA